MFIEMYQLRLKSQLISDPARSVLSLLVRCFTGGSKLAATTVNWSSNGNSAKESKSAAYNRQAGPV